MDGPAAVEALARAFRADLLGLEPELDKAPRGWKGFAHSGEVKLAGQTIGQVAWGGAGQGGWVRVSINGTGCGFVADMDTFSRSVIEAAPEVEHVRVDLAHDCNDRTVLTPGIADEAWQVGGFNPPNGPRPKRDWKGSNEGGWTYYVGTRGVSRNFWRVYEKGMKWVGDHGIDAVHPLGAQAGALEDWVRAELELTNSAGPLPLDVIQRRHEYFAGSCPFFASLVPESEPRRCMVDPVDRAALSLIQGLDNLRKQYGPALHTLRHVFGDDRQLLDLITYACDHSPRLVAGGALLVAGEDVERLKLTRAVQMLSLK